MGSFPETYNDLEGLTLKYEWLIFIEKALKIGSVSWLLSLAFIKPLIIFKTKQPSGSFEKEALENEDQSTQHDRSTQISKTNFKRLKKVDELLLT